MRIDFRGNLTEARQTRAAFVGCGGHAFRNLLPAFQFVPIRLVATCDLCLDKAKAFAGAFGAESSYCDYQQMIANEQLDCVFICIGPDASGQPAYPSIASTCLRAGLHVWTETPIAESTEVLEAVADDARAARRTVMVGYKQMFCPANEKAQRLMCEGSFGGCALATLQYPLYIPTVEELTQYRRGARMGSVSTFLNLACHPVSLLVWLLGMPSSVYLRRANSGAGAALFTFADGAVASIAFTYGSSKMAMLERTTLVSRHEQHIVVENNLRVVLHRGRPLEYGASPDFYAHDASQTSAVWEPELSQGQLYNKGTFLQGYYGEINEFASAILESRPPSKADYKHAVQVTSIVARLIEAQATEVSFTQPH